MFGWLGRIFESIVASKCRKDMERFIRILKGTDADELASLLVVAHVIRAECELRGIGVLPKIEAYVHRVSLPSKHEAIRTSNELMKLVNVYKQNGLMDCTPAISVWIHTCRAYAFPENRYLGKEMWHELSRGFDLVEEVDIPDIKDKHLQVIKRYAMQIPDGMGVVDAE